MTDQISFLPMLEPRDTSFEDNERKASQICDEEFERADGDIVKYVAACVDRSMSRRASFIGTARTMRSIIWRRRE